MDISKITSEFNANISNVKTKLNNKWNNLKSLKSIKNTNLTINYSYNNKGQHIPLLPIFEYIDACTNLLNKTRESKLVSNENKLRELDGLVKNLQELANDNKEEQPIEEENKLPNWITNSGKEALNTNQKIYFKTEKTRSFKNLLISFISPFKFINRSLLPVKINFKNKDVNKALSEFKFDNALNGKDVFSDFSNKLNNLNKTFTDNVNQIITKKINNHKKIDVMIKYQTLEKALECKLINDIKLIKNELKADLAKNKFQENYYDLPDNIVSKLNFIVISNIDELFSSNTIDDLKNLIKEKVKFHDKDVKLGEGIDNIFDSIFNEKIN